MELGTAGLVRADREHLIHPLHHPADHQEPIIYVRGRGATVATEMTIAILIAPHA